MRRFPASAKRESGEPILKKPAIATGDQYTEKANNATIYFKLNPYHAIT
jgi:hypothetical protein